MKETDDFGDLRIAGKDITMYHKEIRREGVEKLQLVQNRNLRVPWKVGNFLVICIPDTQKTIQVLDLPIIPTHVWSDLTNTCLSPNPQARCTISDFPVEYGHFTPIVVIHYFVLKTHLFTG